MSLPQLFQHESGAQVRVIGGEVPMFVVQDLCIALNIKDPSMAIRKMPPSWKGTKDIGTPSGGGVQKMLCVNEAGMWRLVMRSNKPEAVRLQLWICEEVLPALRKTGTYSVSNAQQNGITQTGEIAALSSRLESMCQVMEQLTAEVRYGRTPDLPLRKLVRGCLRDMTEAEENFAFDTARDLIGARHPMAKIGTSRNSEFGIFFSDMDIVHDVLKEVERRRVWQRRYLGPTLPGFDEVDPSLN